MFRTPSKSCYTPNDTLSYFALSVNLSSIETTDWSVQILAIQSHFPFMRLYHGVKYRRWARWCLMFHIALTFRDSEERVYQKLLYFFFFFL